MDIQKEREAFEAWFSQEFRCDEWEYNPFSRMEFNGIDAYSCSTVNTTWSAWQAAKDASHNQAALYQSEINHLAQANQQWREKAAQAIPEGFALVSQKDLLELTIAINAVDLATHTESKTNEVREMWQDIALKLMALGEAQEQSQ